MMHDVHVLIRGWRQISNHLQLPMPAVCPFSIGEIVWALGIGSPVYWPAMIVSEDLIPPAILQHLGTCTKGITSRPQHGFSVTILSVAILSIAILSVAILSVTILSVSILSVAILSVAILSVAITLTLTVALTLVPSPPNPNPPCPATALP